MRTIIVVLAMAIHAAAQTRPLPERVDASTPREVQIGLAESAAPQAVADKATILVLGKKGYEVARTGSNGFTCLIVRERADTLEPECYDAEGSATTLKVDMFREALRARGVSEEEIARQVEAGYKERRFQAPRRPGIVYMLSSHNRVFDPSQGRIIPFPGHLMFYAPYLTEKDVGEGTGAPYLTAPGKPENLMVVVPAGR